MSLELNKIHLGDCLAILPALPDSSIDLTVTSPPYDNLRTYKGFVFDFEGIARELYRVTKDGGVVVWAVGDAAAGGSETGNSFRQALYFKDVCGFNLLDTMIYQKLNHAGPASGSGPTRYYQAFEYMFVFSRGKPRCFNGIEDRSNSKFGKHPKDGWKGGGGRGANGEIRKPRIMKAVKEFGRRTNIWPYAVGGKDVGHPAPFPEALARDHILTWSNPGAVVLDPFAGSGTTLAMALQSGRNYIGIEFAAEYLPIIRQRLATTGPLFTTVE